MPREAIAIEYATTVHTGSEPGQPIGYLLMRVHRALRALTDEWLRPQGFTMPQVAVLFALEERSGLSTAELARLAFVTPQAMGELLAGLEAKGCVVRHAHDTHGRILPAELTPAGVEARALCEAALGRAETQMLSALSDDERRILAGSLERCLLGLHKTSISTEASLRNGSAKLQARPPKLRTAEP